MIRSFFLLAAIVSSNAFANFPKISYWQAIGTCDVRCRSEGSSPSSAQMILIVRENRICGEIQQDYGLRYANRNPNGKVVGKILRGIVTLGFTDSFADPQYPGVASLTINGEKLNWMTIIAPPVGYLKLDKFQFQKVSSSASSKWPEGAKDNILKICREYFEDTEANSERKYLERQ